MGVGLRATPWATMRDTMGLTMFTTPQGKEARDGLIYSQFYGLSKPLLTRLRFMYSIRSGAAAWASRWKTCSRRRGRPRRLTGALSRWWRDRGRRQWRRRWRAWWGIGKPMSLTYQGLVHVVVDYPLHTWVTFVHDWNAGTRHCRWEIPYSNQPQAAIVKPPALRFCHPGPTCFSKIPYLQASQDLRASMKAQMMSQPASVVIGRWYLAPLFDGHVCMGKSTTQLVYGPGYHKPLGWRVLTPTLGAHGLRKSGLRHKFGDP